ncbi:site-2 protease family protein [Salinibacterium sp. G-O1]|uniref:M50 family metallopeptidase n=1 Tax=Salinibacterium sp. G-O1 TaxID=3046208 RepID=UPI0024B8FB27|nr:site-2 protease family protein [Salinibacterium sp. G-O1]MDJ0334719.1 site-2 protease family protein [Salinibacterium sp. G-O1]
METVLLYVLGIVIIVIGLALSIGLHELGHLVPAKLFGVRVTQYMIGFGPTIFSRKRGETEYGVKAIPLGGYISMAGMFPPAKKGDRSRTATTGVMQSLVQEARTSSADTMVAIDETTGDETVVDESRAFYKLPVFKRVIIMLGGPFMNLVIAILLYAVLLTGFGLAQASTTVGSVSECVVPATSQQQECDASSAPSPGLAAGLMPGDLLVSMNGTAITSWAQATSIIRASAADDLSIVVNRDGSDVTLAATPLLTERYVYDAQGVIQKDANGTSITEEVGFLGIGPATEVVQQPITAVLPAVGDNISRVTHLILNLPQRMIDVVNAAFGPTERDPNGPISVVGVGRLAGEITSLNTIPVVERASALVGLVASLNVALMVFNLVPLMPLDGGHVAGALFEGIRRFFAKLFGRKDPGPVDVAKIIPLTFVVASVLIVMSAILIYADIVKPISIL